MESYCLWNENHLFQRHREEGCLALICGGSSAYDISFYNMKVRDLLFVMGVMALCGCQESPFSQKDSQKYWNLKKLKKKKKKMVKPQIRLDLT